MQGYRDGFMPTTSLTSPALLRPQLGCNVNKRAPRGPSLGRRHPIRKTLLPFALVVGLVGSHASTAHAQALKVDVVITSATLLDATPSSAFRLRPVPTESLPRLRGQGPRSAPPGLTAGPRARGPPQASVERLPASRLNREEERWTRDASSGPV